MPLLDRSGPHGYEHDIRRAGPGHGDYSSIKRDQTSIVATGQRQQMRVGDETMRYHAVGIEQPIADDQLDVIG